MVIRFHPEYPSVLAAGSFNGEVLVYDLNAPEEPVAISPITGKTVACLLHTLLTVPRHCCRVHSQRARDRYLLDI